MSPTTKFLPLHNILDPLFSLTGIKWKLAAHPFLVHPEDMCQLLPVDNTQFNSFWYWHLTYNPQWFTTPEDAAASLARAWETWQSMQRSMNRPLQDTGPIKKIPHPSRRDIHAASQ